MNTYENSHQGRANVLSKIKAQLVSLRFYFLFFWTFGMIAPVWIGWNNDESWVSYYLAIIFMFLAICVKIKMNYTLISLKEFLQMQGDFVIPYAFNIINIILWCKYNRSLNQVNAGGSDARVVTHSIVYSLIAFNCSLLMSPKTNSKVQYWVFLMTLFHYLGVQVARLIIYIQQLNHLKDVYSENINTGMQTFIMSSIYPFYNMNDTNTYLQTYNLNSGNMSFCVSAKDYIVFLVVTVIAEILILMDMILRPIQKQEQMLQEDEEQNQFEKKGRISQMSEFKNTLIKQ